MLSRENELVWFLILQAAALVVSVSKSPSALVSNPILMTDETCSLVAPADFATSAHEAATSAAADVIAACIFMPLKLFDPKEQFPIVPATTVDSLATDRATFI